MNFKNLLPFKIFEEFQNSSSNVLVNSQNIVGSSQNIVGSSQEALCNDLLKNQASQNALTISGLVYSQKALGEFRYLDLQTQCQSQEAVLTNEKDILIQEKDKIIQEKDKIIQEKDSLLETLKNENIIINKNLKEIINLKNLNNTNTHTNILYGVTVTLLVLLIILSYFHFYKSSDSN